MENPRPEKVAVVTEVREKFDGADAVVLTDYRGLDVAAMSTLRRALSAAGGDFKIYKNTLVRFAARDLDLDLDELLLGDGEGRGVLGVGGVGLPDEGPGGGVDEGLVVGHGGPPVQRGV